MTPSGKTNTLESTLLLMKQGAAASSLILSIAVILTSCSMYPTRNAFSGPILSNAASEADTLWVKEELYFGALIPAGGMVTDSLWQRFLDNEVTPRFPEGYTSLDAMGSYQVLSGVTVKEPSRIIILLYNSSTPMIERRVLEVMERYRKQFGQE